MIMEVNYLVKAAATAQSEEVRIDLSAEYAKGATPTLIQVNGSGYVQRSGERVSISMVCKYDPVNKSMKSISGSNVDNDLIETATLKADEFYTEVTTEPQWEEA